MFESYSWNELLPYLVGFGSLAVIGLMFLVPVVNLIQSSGHDVPRRTRYSGEPVDATVRKVEHDIISGVPLGDHRIWLRVPIDRYNTAIVEVNSATYAGIRNRGIKSFSTGLKELMCRMTDSGATVAVWLTDGRRIMVDPSTWYRIVTGGELRSERASAVPRTSLPEWILPLQSVPPPRPVRILPAGHDLSSLPSAQAGDLADRENWDIPYGLRPTPPYEEVVISFSDDFIAGDVEEIVLARQ